MKLACLIALVIGSLTNLSAQVPIPAPSPWEQPAADLAEQVAAILGPGQAHLTIRNLSSIPTDQIPSIRRQLTQDLKSHGVLASGTESANAIRVALSENARERLWVAEIVEGDETRVAMVRVEPGADRQSQSVTGLMLRKQTILTTGDTILAVLESPNGMVAVEPEEIVIFAHASDAWHEQKRFGIGQVRPLTRDPRAVFYPSPDAGGFAAYAPGSACAGNYQPPPTSDWVIHCHDTDDPWPIIQSSAASNSTAMKAFYNTTRNHFTGVVTPGTALDLPPFYTAVPFPRANGTALLINGIDGKFQLMENGALKTITGTRDWGSDFAALHTGCGAGTQIIASSSGEALTDSLRAYELPALEAIPASPPLTMDGTVTALWTDPDSKSVLAVVRKQAGADRADQYEVDRVKASCN
jgi:hypothetical protein